MAALRGLTGEQRESINLLTNQLDEIKLSLDDSTKQLDESMQKIRKMSLKYSK